MHHLICKHHLQLESDDLMSFSAVFGPNKVNYFSFAFSKVVSFISLTAILTPYNA